MRRVRRPELAPEWLAQRAPAATGALLEQAVTAVNRALRFRKTVYASKAVKAALVDMQFGKCFLCESPVQVTSPGDVEHFRPKGGVRQSPESPLERRGYYWLAYSWSNLFFCCELCNRSFKKNLFPLLNPTARARGPADDIASERPVFIDPTQEDPAEYLSFVGPVLIAPSNNERGRMTIELLELNRDTLRVAREKHYGVHKALFDLCDPDMDVSDPRRVGAEACLAQAVAEDAPYLSMMRSAVDAGFASPGDIVDTEAPPARPPTRLRRRLVR